MCEINQQPDLIQLRTFEGNLYAIVMTVGVLALALVAAQGVS